MPFSGILEQVRTSILLYTSLNLDGHANLEIGNHPDYFQAVPLGRCEYRMVVGPKTRVNSPHVSRRIESQGAAAVSKQEPYHSGDSVLFESIKPLINVAVGTYAANLPRGYAPEISSVCDPWN